MMGNAFRLIGMAYKGVIGVLVIIWIAWMMSAQEDHRRMMAEAKADKPVQSRGTFASERPSYSSYGYEDPYSRPMDDTVGEKTYPTSGDWGN